MEIHVNTEWSLGQLIEFQREQILRVNHEYQRGLRWTDTQKRLFLDSIFRGYSSPAFYFHKRQTRTTAFQNTHFDIVDGQQRVDAIYAYSEGAFKLLDPSEDEDFRFPNFVKDAPCPWGGRRFEELPEDLKEALMGHKVVVYEISTDNENAIRDLFIRLQAGTPLTPQDKRDSWPGNFTEFVLRVGGKSGVDKWFGLPLFKEIARVSNESRRRQLAAQVFMLFWTVREETRFCDIRSANLDEFYRAQVGFDARSPTAKRFEQICTKLHAALQGRPRIVGHYVIHVVLLADALLSEFKSGWEQKLAAALFEFERRRKEAVESARSERDASPGRYYTEYGHLTQTRSDDARTIRRRHAFFSEEMLSLLMPTKLDARRSFTDFERQTVFFRDEGVCQWCRMKGESRNVAWQDSEVHHVSPHAHGGLTEIANGALVHRDCHPKSDGDVERFRLWWNRSSEPPEPPSAGPKPAHPTPPDGTLARFTYMGQTHRAEFRRGKLVLEGGRPFGSFSAASRHITGTHRNGWMDWELCLPTTPDVWVLADTWRARGLVLEVDDF